VSEDTAADAEVWHVICGSQLREMLREVAAGADPDFVYLEAYVNAERDD
jgi:hypothetical protein